jgi:hypothetical protein
MTPSEEDQKIWVVFCDAPRFWYIRFLKAGFRHCFIVLKTKEAWVTIDPLLTHMAVMTHPVIGGFDVPSFLARQGMHVIRILNPKKSGHRGWIQWPFLSLCTCVGLVKRMLGIWMPFVLTPHALYRTLLKNFYIEKEKS